MKKLLAILLSVAMVLSMASVALAAGDASAEMTTDEDLIPLQNEEDGSALEPIVTTSFAGTTLAYPRFATYVNEDAAEDINDDVSWHNGAIYSEAGEHNVSGVSIIMNTEADGSDTNDFSGLGAALLAAGQGVVLNVTDANIETTGVAKLALFTDSGAVSIVKNSTLTTNSGTIYDGYMSTADQTIMVSPPWVLGLGGAKTNTRTTNIMGDYSTAAYIDSTFNAGGWGALSTDSGTNMHMLVVNTEVNVEDSGYGAYTIGNSTEDYYGVTENVSTYANIMTGGVATYQSYTGGTELDLVQFNGEQDEYGHGAGGDVVATVKSDAVADGEVVNSTINSENFGFMCHANGSDGYNIVNVLDGTTVNSEDAIFLVKKVNSIFNVDSAELNSANGVLLQIIDNDDDYVGLDFAAQWGFENGYGHSIGNHIPTFNQVFHEEPGYANEFAVNESDADNWTSELNITNTAVDGDVWNSTGYVGANPATTLTVNLGAGAELTGLISAGAFSHTTKDATVGDGDWSGASALGHVTNIVNSNGKNIVNVALTDDAVWTVESDSAIDSLTVADDAQVVVPADVTLTVAGTEYTDTTLTADSEIAAPAAAPAEEAAEEPAAEESAEAADFTWNGQKEVWSILPTTAAAGLVAINDAMGALMEAEGFTYVKQDAQGDPSAQVDYVEQAIAAGNVGALMIAAMDVGMLQDAVQEAQEAGIAVAYLGITPDYDIGGYICTNYDLTGMYAVQAAEDWVTNRVAEGGNIPATADGKYEVAVDTYYDITDGVYRSNAIVGTVNASDVLVGVSNTSSYGDSNSYGAAFDNAQNVLSAHPDCHVFIAYEPEEALGAADAIEQYCYDNDLDLADYCVIPCYTEDDGTFWSVYDTVYDRETGEIIDESASAIKGYATYGSSPEGTGEKLATILLGVCGQFPDYEWSFAKPLYDDTSCGNIYGYSQYWVEGDENPALQYRTEDVLELAQ